MTDANAGTGPAFKFIRRSDNGACGEMHLIGEVGAWGGQYSGVGQTWYCGHATPVESYRERTARRHFYVGMLARGGSDFLTRLSLDRMYAPMA